MALKIASVVAALSLGVICAQAQSLPPADQVLHLLQSQNLRDKAWGAWYAGASGDPALRETLLDQLRLARSLPDFQPETEAYAYIQALFDSLIQIPGPIPNDVILPFESSWRSETLILLSRDPSAPGTESALLDMREQSISEPVWAAVNDLLFKINPRPFFQRTLQEIRITHDFVISEQAVAFCGGGIGCGLSSRRFPKGFPPIAVYQLQATMASRGDTLFQEQPVAIHYRRIVVPTDGEVELSDCSNPTEVRQIQLAQFFGAIDGLSIQQSEELFQPRSIIGDAAHAASEIEKLLGEQAASIQALVGHAAQRGLVNDSGTRFTIEATVEDLRRDRSNGVFSPHFWREFGRTPLQ